LGGLSSSYVEITAPANTTSIKIFWRRYASTGPFNWSVNGGTKTAVNTAGADSDFQYTSVTCTAGDVLRVEGASGGGAIIDGFFCHGGDESKGIRCWDSGHSGYSASAYITSSPEVWFRAFNVIQPSLVVIALGANDSTFATAASFKTSMLTLISKINAQITTTPSIVLIGCWQQTLTTIEPSKNYNNALSEIAANNSNCYFVDLSEVVIKTSPSSTAGGLVPDQMHPGVSGSEIIANAIYSEIMPH